MIVMPALGRHEFRYELIEKLFSTILRGAFCLLELMRIILGDYLKYREQK